MACNCQASSEEATKVALHYGTMRFSMFTVFTAVLGALLVFPFSDGGRAFFTQPKNAVFGTMFAVGALILCLLFMAAEVRITMLVDRYQAAAFGSELPEYHIFWTWLVGLTMISPYLFAAVFWVTFLNGDLLIPPPSR